MSIIQTLSFSAGIIIGEKRLDNKVLQILIAQILPNYNHDQLLIMMIKVPLVCIGCKKSCILGLGAKAQHLNEDVWTKQASPIPHVWGGHKETDVS